jgi:hypothetical protein
LRTGYTIAVANEPETSNLILHAMLTLTIEGWRIVKKNCLAVTRGLIGGYEYFD